VYSSDYITISAKKQSLRGNAFPEWQGLIVKLNAG
jgi:hypothetical protein